jgi:hypothetical protein
MGFMFNTFHAGHPQIFKNFSGHELLVAGRMLKSNQDGIFSSGGFCGRCYEGDSLNISVEYQFNGYLNNLPCPNFMPYKSQIGFQGMCYSIFDRISPFSGTGNLFVLRSLNALLMAVMLTLVIYWFYLEGNFLAALLVFLASLLTPWFAYHGRNMWFVLWVSYLPFVVMIYALRRESLAGRLAGKRIIIAGSLAMLVNFIVHGYEWATTTMVMAAVPLFFYWQKDNWRFLELCKRLLGLLIGYLSGLLVTLSIVAFQVFSITGKFSDGIDHIIYSFAKRSYGGIENIPERLLVTVNSNIIDVFKIYLNAQAYLIPKPIKEILPSHTPAILFYQIIILFIIFTLVIVVKGKPLRFRKGTLKNLRAFTIVTWISILAPFSWYIIFKGHSYIHGFLNPITWFMPFCLFGFGLIGLTLGSLEISRKSNANQEGIKS